MHWPVRMFCVVLTVLHAVEAPLSGIHHQGLAANGNDHTMRRSLSAGGGIPGGRKKLPLSLGFKCAYCGGEFGSYIYIWTAIADTAIPSVHPVPIP